MTALLAGPIADRHAALGATFAEFGGWDMPVSYSGTGAEHAAVRTAVGLFDVSHLGKALVAGPGAAALINRTLTNDLTKITPGKAQYTLCCNAAGGVIDDLIAYLTEPLNRGRVDLTDPDRILAVEILGKNTGMSLLNRHELLDVNKVRVESGHGKV